MSGTPSSVSVREWAVILLLVLEGPLRLIAELNHKESFREDSRSLYSGVFAPKGTSSSWEAQFSKTKLQSICIQDTVQSKVLLPN